jgi:NapC/NirT cytochrome c family, N-terminal region
VPSRQELARSPVAIVGAVITTVSAVVFITMLLAALAGWFENPYAGLVVFVLIPAFFILGLLLMPLGLWLHRRKVRLNPALGAEDWPVLDFRIARVRQITLAIVALTAVNLLIVLLAGYGSLHWMESPRFCGQACHTPMEPQFAAWQESIHGRVACVSCHISEGAVGFVHAKLSGVRQLVQVATNSYPHPIPPGAKMPAGQQAETCTRCHVPGRPTGARVQVIREYADDEANSETMTVLQLQMSRSPNSPRAIHWHADPAVKVEYVATDEQRQKIPYVRVTDAKGQVKEYVAPDTTEQVRNDVRHTMDCVDCHNTVGHPISQTPERAVDRAIAGGHVSRQLPFARREGVRLVKASYPTQDAAASAIDRGLRDFYKARGGSIDSQEIARTVASLQAVYRQNVTPSMNVTWGSYPTNTGHMTSDGCFRCHDDSHEAKDGSKISADCEYCHKQIETPQS